MRAKTTTTPRICEWCKTSFLALSYNIRIGKAKYCSTTCYGMSKRKPTQPIEDRFWSKVDKTDDCWIWTASLDRKGYGYFMTVKPKKTGAHRFSYELAHGPIPDGLYVCHHCDVPACVRPDHLFLGSQTDNMQDAVAKGRHIHGEQQWTARLTTEIIVDIRARYANGERLISLARAYGIDSGHVYNIVHRKKWKHVA